jgi:hypothetical protein
MLAGGYDVTPYLHPKREDKGMVMTIDETQWSDFQRRLARLERQRRIAAIVGVVTLVAAILGVCRFSDIATAAPATAPSREVIRTRGIEVVDSRNRVVARLSSDGDEPSLVMTHDDVKVYLGIWRAGSEDGPVSQLYMERNGVTGVLLNGPSRDPRLTLTSSLGEGSQTKVYTGAIWLSEGEKKVRYRPEK